MLTALHLGDRVYGIDITSYTKEPGVEYIKIEDTPSKGYVDIGSNDIVTGNNVPGIAIANTSPIVNWDRLGRNLGYDYLYINDQIKALATKDIASYTAEEQQVFLEHHIKDVSELESIYDFEKVVATGLEYLANAQATRDRRMAVSTIYLQAAIGDASAKLVGKQVASAVLLYKQQDDPLLIEYLDSTGTYAGDGFLDQGFSSIVPELTMEQIRDEIRSFLVDGTKTDGSPYYSI